MTERDRIRALETENRALRKRVDRIDAMLALLPPRHGMSYEGRPQEIEMFWTLQAQIRVDQGYPLIVAPPIEDHQG